MIDKKGDRPTCHDFLKFRYCEKAEKFEKKISHHVTKSIINVKTKLGGFLNFCGLLKISEL